MDSNLFERGKGPLGTNTIKLALVKPFFDIPVPELEGIYPENSNDVMESAFHHIDGTLSKIIVLREGDYLAYMVKVSNGTELAPQIYYQEMDDSFAEAWEEKPNARVGQTINYTQSKTAAGELTRVYPFGKPIPRPRSPPHR